jgi:cell division protein FtsB
MLKINPKKAFWILTATLLVLAVFLPRYTKLQELRDKNRVLGNKIKRIEQQNASLENELACLKNDPVYQERIVRDKLGVVRKGEVIYKLNSQE